MSRLLRSPREVTDPDFGTLKFQSGAWHGAIASRGVPIFFRCGRRGLDAGLREAGRQAIRDLAGMEGRARDYLTAVAKDKRWPGLRLAAVEVSRPASEWVRENVAPEHPAAAAAILRGTPIVSLEFEIAGDRNVADVIFLDGVAVGWDYH